MDTLTQSQSFKQLDSSVLVSGIAGSLGDHCSPLTCLASIPTYEVLNPFVNAHLVISISV